MGNVIIVRRQPWPYHQGSLSHESRSRRGKIYKDGVAGTPDTYSTALRTTTEHYYIGRESHENIYNWDVIIDEARVSNIARSAGWATIRFSLAFSSSSAFKRLSSERVIPPYLLFQRWMVAGETPCSRAALTTGVPESTSWRIRNTCASEYLLAFTFASSCSYFTGVSHSM